MPLTPSGGQFEYSGSELDSLAEARNYYAWVLKQFEPFLGPTVIEVGAGIGTFSEFLLGSPRVRELIAIEPAANTYPELEKKFALDARVKTLHGYLSDHYRDLQANAVVAVNVLEHVENHEQFLREAYAGVVSGGSLLLFVPAIPAIYGSLDKAFEHYRRYTKASLRQVIQNAGWQPRRISYMNLPGIAAWFMAGKIMKKTSVAPGDAKAYDRLVIPWLSKLEAVVPPPIGSNLVAIATKA
ncbi:MAG TPA: methyltransferase domain-containing protein [Gemmatimonadaceae bacterium]|nr:methyltransferase domain-containing protein [Gemmatimonadaceae bacterium]